MQDHHYHDYGSGTPSNYMTHGSLVLDGVEALDEFMSMDLLETAVIAVFPGGEDLDSGTHAEFEEYKSLAAEFSHLFRFAHAASDAVVKNLQLDVSADGPHRSAVMVAPAALLAANHPRAGGWVRFPGARVTAGALKTFLLMEAAPLVGQYDWRALERAAAAELPAVTVFAKVAGELKHTYHQDVGSGEGDGASGEGDGAGGEVAGGGGWTFDGLSAALRPTGLAFQHDANLLVADKRAHGYEMHAYHLQDDGALPGRGRLGARGGLGATYVSAPKLQFDAGVLCSHLCFA